MYILVAIAVFIIGAVLLSYLIGKGHIEIFDSMDEDLGNYIIPGLLLVVLSIAWPISLGIAGIAIILFGVGLGIKALASFFSE